jgi:outer membrane protein TolC
LLPVALVLPLALSRPAGAQTPEGAGRPAQPTPAAPALVLNLAECLELAHQRQPRIAAQRASLAAAEDGKRSLDALHVPGPLAPDLPIRRRQAACGVTAAAAALDRAERATVYAVTRTYFTVLYAREQERIARGVVERLSATHDAAKQGLEEGVRNVTDADVKRAAVYLRLARAKRVQAAQGVKRALAALKEAVGLGPDACLDIPPGRLPEPDARPCLGELVAAALARRGELIQASVFAQVTCLEVQAQASSSHKRLETFAAGSDIHAQQVPQEVRDNEYRPGATPPEMPTMMAGPRAERVEHAKSLHARAQAVVEVTRNLITLEAEDAYLRWEEAANEVREAREAAQTGEKLANDLSKDFAAGLKVRVDEVVNARVLAAQAWAQYNEFLYRQIIALADLERVTAGGFCAHLVEAVTPRARPVPKEGVGAR